MYPGSMLGEQTARPIPRADGGVDLAIAHEHFHDIFCQDLPEAEAALLAMTQRPAAQAALVEPSGEPLWRTVPSWFVIGEEDRIIPAELQRHMALRARAQREIVIEGASHALPVSRPDAAVHPILEAAALRVAA